MEKVVPMEIKNALNAVIIEAVTAFPSIIKVGSFARGDYTEKSDIDIVIDYDDSISSNEIFNSFSLIHDLIYSCTQKKLDIIKYCTLFYEPEDEIDKETSESILNDIVWLYEK